MKASMISALSLAAIVNALPATSKLPTRATGVSVTGSVAVKVNDQDGVGAGTDAYTLHKGNGAYGFPSIDQWVNFEDMFTANEAFMKISCENNAWGDNDSADEIADIKTAIDSVAATTLVDHRFILAIIMQESKGCVRVKTTTSPDGTVRNPGLMQDHNGANSCSGVNPCPQSTITGMVTDGTAGTAAGDGLAGTINEAQSKYGVSGAQAFYYAARIYNSGSIPSTSDLGNAGGATNCYVSDVANRLTGWVQATTGCTEATAE